jgi:hypothetical protein
MKPLGRELTVGACIIFAGFLPADCGPIVTVINTFELPACLSASFQMPNSATRASYGIIKIHPPSRDQQICRTADTRARTHLYWLRESNIDRLYYYARLNKGSYCSLDVVYSYQSGGADLDRRREEESQRWATIVAELVLGDSSGLSRIPPPTVQRLRSNEEVDSWCAGGQAP